MNCKRKFYIKKLFRRRKILWSTFVSGGAGFIGSTLVNRLIEEGNEVIVVDDLSMGNVNNLIDNKRLTFFKADIRDIELVREIFKNNSFSYIFHLAAVASVADSIETIWNTPS